MDKQLLTLSEKIKNHGTDQLDVGNLTPLIDDMNRKKQAFHYTKGLYYEFIEKLENLSKEKVPFLSYLEKGTQLIGQYGDLLTVSVAGNVVVIETGSICEVCVVDRKYHFVLCKVSLLKLMARREFTTRCVVSNDEGKFIISGGFKND